MDEESTPTLRGDRLYTLRVSVLSLIAGLPLAILTSVLFASLNQTPSSTSTGQVSFTVNAFGAPLAFLAGAAILALSLFWLPMRLAHRAERVLDPQIYPLFGVVCVAALLIIAFVAAIFLKII